MANAKCQARRDDSARSSLFPRRLRAGSPNRTLTPIVVAASIQRRRGPISVAWTYVLDDPDADWFEIGLQLRDDRPAAKRVMDELRKAGFRDGLGNVAGGIEGIWAMPRRGFRDLATWRAALRRVRKLMR